MREAITLETEVGEVVVDGVGYPVFVWQLQSWAQDALMPDAGPSWNHIVSGLDRGGCRKLVAGLRRAWGLD